MWLRVAGEPGVLGAEAPLNVGEQRFVAGDRVLNAPGIVVGAGEVVAGGERVGVLGTEAPLNSASSGW